MRATDQQLSALLEYCGEFARQMIEDSGEFYPFGAEIDASGELRALGFWDGNERPSPRELYAYAQSVLTQKAASGEALAGAVAVNVNIPPELASPMPDGIRVHVEALGFSRLIYQPYAIKRSGLLGRNRTVEYGELFAVEVEQVMFQKA